MAQVVENLPSMREAMNLIPKIAKRTKKSLTFHEDFYCIIPFSLFRSGARNIEMKYILPHPREPCVQHKTQGWK
jgi:hypothetical protein